MFQWGDYKAEREVKIRGNCAGASILESAIDQVIEDIFNDDGITLVNDLGDRCAIEIPAEGDEDWGAEQDIRDSIVGVKIVDFVEEQKD